MTVDNRQVILSNRAKWAMETWQFTPWF